jgi:aldehyde:ferredoxin oxidoreductase
LAETLTKLDADFSELKFGNEQALLATIEKIAYREGLGDILADGVRLASKKIGHGSERFATHVKGMELPAYDPRGAYGMGLAYATSDRGACHMRAWTILAETRGELGERFSVKGRAKLVKQLQDDRAIRFSSVLCSFAALDVSDYLELLNFATGFELSEEDYFCIGERIWNLTRLFNVREGISRKDDCLPPQMMAPVPAGPAKGSAITTEMLDEMLDEYYELRGWDRNGIPTRKKLISLGLV